MVITVRTIACEDGIKRIFGVLFISAFWFFGRVLP